MKLAETSAESFFFKGINTWQFFVELYLPHCVLVKYPVFLLVSVISSVVH